MTPELTWPAVLSTLLGRDDLSADAASWAMRQVMSGEASPSQVAGFVMALQAKGVSVEELTGIAGEMLAHARRIEVPGPSLDIVGTGGDRQNTVNISTMSAMVASAAGATVVKHGNRAASSKSGTADCLEALGVVLSLGPDGVVDVAREVGMTFCFAQDFHPSMRHAAGPRRELGVPTVFNLLGPLTNPAQPSASAVGVAMEAAAPLIAGVFAERGSSAAVFRGRDGLDEITVSTCTDVWWVAGGAVQRFVIDPAALGEATFPLDDLRGGEPAENADVVRSLFDGDRSGRMAAVHLAVTLNAGAALAVLDDDGTVRDQSSFETALRAGMDQAAAAIDSGAARDKLTAWADATRRRAG
ncbi:MAG: anthranilate phosphoribosyltransferase [Mobilicoccus sp.]|nr:anthranilate phosphoribosyltransferase [Mobilicoccus sp.]